MYASPDTSDTQGITIIKVDADNYSKYLAGAVFDLYRYSTSSKTYQKVQSGLQVNANGSLYFNALSTNTAYQLVETKAPKGYTLNSEPLTFLLEGTGGSLAAPDDFPEYEKCPPGSEIFFPNTKSADSITVRKEWKDEQGDPDTGEHDPIDIQLFRKTNNDALSPELVKTVTLEGPSWQMVFEGLEETDSSGNPYLYYIVEVPKDDHWNISYINNEGIPYGTIVAINREKQSGVELPSTGSGGSERFLFYGAGLLMAATTLGFLLRYKRQLTEEGP